MIDRRKFFAAAAGLAGAAAFSSPALANAFKPYVASEVAAAIKTGEPVLVHVFAPWCLQCHIQRGYLHALLNDPKLAHVALFRVDYDRQKDVLQALGGVPRSTLIGYLHGRETKRMSWGTQKSDVMGIVDSVLKG